MRVTAKKYLSLVILAINSASFLSIYILASKSCKFTVFFIRNYILFIMVKVISVIGYIAFTLKDSICLNISFFHLIGFLVKQYIQMVYIVIFSYSWVTMFLTLIFVCSVTLLINFLQKHIFPFQFDNLPILLLLGTTLAYTVYLLLFNSINLVMILFVALLLDCQHIADIKNKIQITSTDNALFVNLLLFETVLNIASNLEHMICIQFIV